MSALEAEDVLEDGEWVTRHGVCVWQPARVVKAVPDPLDLTQLIACPTCHAKVTETCRTASGHRTTNHGSRLAPRLCQCGANLRWKRRYCDPCRDAEDAANKADWRARRREAS